MKTNNTVEIIHKELLNLARSFCNYCDEENLRYYIIGGTLLGAIRHEGFIPWDDDMDIAMPRDDFETFINNYPQGKYKIITYKEGKDYKYYLPKLYDERYIIKEKTGNVTNLFIDIFPIDGMPNNPILRKVHILRILYHRMKMAFYYNDTIDMDRKRKAYEKALIVLAKRIPFKRLIDPMMEKDVIDKLLKRYSMNSSKYSGTIMGAYKEREIVETRLFGEPVSYRFEDILLKGPECYDEYLTHMYGDYMTPPDSSHRGIHISELIKQDTQE